MLVEPPVSTAPYPPAASGANLGRAMLFGATSITGYAITRLCGGNLVAVASRAATARSSRWHAADAEAEPALADLMERERPDLVIWAHAVCDVAKCEADPAWAVSCGDSFQAQRGSPRQYPRHATRSLELSAASGASSS